MKFSEMHFVVVVDSNSESLSNVNQAMIPRDSILSKGQQNLNVLKLLVLGRNIMKIWS